MMTVLDDAVAHVVVVAVMTPRDHVLVVAVAVEVDMLVMVVPRRAVPVAGILGGRGGRRQDERGRGQGGKACLHRSDLSDCSAMKAIQGALNAV
ncbi:hypothetical protein [Methylobacterium planeticum]|uniref:hypothetical protein n=1 Tax=Methylobacterium planeticum TaxID=2615211 RepID=UPI001783FAE0|nr:hypothetical protein [Methylobacterium planeticum]